MPNTRRQNILANINTVLTAVGTLNTVATNRVTVVDGDVTLPFANITSGSATVNLELSDIGSTGQEEFEWEIPIIVFSDSTDIETLLGDIHVAMMTDDSRGGYADITNLTSVEMVEDFDMSNNVQAMTITYEITYGLPRGTTA
jgi:hypothetical protein